MDIQAPSESSSFVNGVNGSNGVNELNGVNGVNGVNGEFAAKTFTSPHSSLSETLTIRDNRTGQIHDIPICNNAVKATDFKSISIDRHLNNLSSGSNDELRILDPGFKNTAVMESSVTSM